MITYSSISEDRVSVGQKSIYPKQRKLLKVKSYDDYNSIDEIRVLEMNILLCEDCYGLNIPKKTMSTPAYGDYNANLLVVGQSLHSYDSLSDTRQIPFIWLNSPDSYGAEIFSMLADLGYTFDDGLLVTNVVKCHPPGNRRSDPFEVKNCKPYLDAELDIVKPKIILLLGSDAAKSFNISLFLDYYTNTYKDKYIVAYHPSYMKRFIPKSFSFYLMEIQKRIKAIEAL